MDSKNKDNRFNPLNMTELTRDAFRSLRMNIAFSGGDKDVQTLVVTSAVPNGGKTSVSIGLGISMAESMKNTLIIECDCRRPSVGNRLKLRPGTNWIDVLYKQGKLEDAIVKTSVPNLFFLDAEPGQVHSVELLNSGRFRELVERAKQNFDFIIFDTPPLGSFIDATVLSKYSDGVIMVVSSGTKEIRVLKETIEQLKKADAKILGVVLNRVSAHHLNYYHYGDYYYRNQGKRHAGKRTESAKAMPAKATYVPTVKEKADRRTAPDRPMQVARNEQANEAELTWEDYTNSMQKAKLSSTSSDTER